MKALPDDVLARMGAIFAHDPRIEVAVLHGSAARGRLRGDSDVDIYLRLSAGVDWPAHREWELAGELSAIAGREIDLAVEDEERTSVILRLEVARHGRLLYEAHPGAWVHLRAEAMLAYADLEPWMARCGEGVRRALAACGAVADGR